MKRFKANIVDFWPPIVYSSFVINDEYTNSMVIYGATWDSFLNLLSE